MKKTLLSCLVSLLTFAGYSQYSIVSERSYGGSDNDVFLDIQPTSDSGYVVAGYSFSADNYLSINKGEADAWIIKLDANGDTIWTKSYGGSSYDYIHEIKQTADGGYIAVGKTYSSNGDISNNYGEYDCWILKLDASGDIEWSKIYGGSLSDFATSVQETAGGNFLVLATTKSTDNTVVGNHGEYDIWLLKLNTTGDTLWTKCLGGSGSESSRKLQETDDGNFIFSAYASSTDGDVIGNHGSSDAWIVKIDTSGNILWNNSYGTSGYDGAVVVKETTDTNYIAVGAFSSNGSYDLWVAKLNLTGDTIWQKTYGCTTGTFQYETARDVLPTTDGGFLVVGETNSSGGDINFNHGGYDVWILKLDSAGNLEWEETYGGSVDEYAYKLLKIDNDHYCFAGGTSSSDEDVSTNFGASDGWFVKIGITNGLPFAGDFLSGEIRLYPNPAKDNVNILVPESDNENALLTLTNINGEIVVHKQITIKDKVFKINLQNMKPGFYVVKIMTSRYIVTKKLIIK